MSGAGSWLWGCFRGVAILASPTHAETLRGDMVLGSDVRPLGIPQQRPRTRWEVG